MSWIFSKIGFRWASFFSYIKVFYNSTIEYDLNIQLIYDQDRKGPSQNIITYLSRDFFPLVNVPQRAITSQPFCGAKFILQLSSRIVHNRKPANHQPNDSTYLLHSRKRRTALCISINQSTQHHHQQQQSTQHET